MNRSEMEEETKKPRAGGVNSVHSGAHGVPKFLGHCKRSQTGTVSLVFKALSITCSGALLF